MWLYGLVNPAYAFSFHDYAVFFLFIFGYAWLFAMIGASPQESFLLSFTLFFTGFTQYWWTSLGPILALFPLAHIKSRVEIKPFFKTACILLDIH